jgi:hypothetical protein
MPIVTPNESAILPCPGPLVFRRLRKSSQPIAERTVYCCQTAVIIRWCYPIPREVKMAFTQIVDIGSKIIIGFSPIVTALVALYAVRVADEQRRLAAHKLSSDLFDRRIAIYNDTMNLLRQILQNNRVPMDVAYKFARDIEQTYFLLGPDAFNYFQEIFRRTLRISNLTEQIDRVVGSLGAVGAEHHDQNITTRMELFHWFEDQIDVVRKLFLPFMALGGIASPEPRRSTLRPKRHGEPFPS